MEKHKMTNEQIIKEVINRKYKGNLQNDTHLSEICEDSFSRVELLFDIEQQLNKKIPENEILNIETFGDLVYSISKLQGN